jgi:hypothetical protein
VTVVSETDCEAVLRLLSPLVSSAAAVATLLNSATCMWPACEQFPPTHGAVRRRAPPFAFCE